MALFTLQPLPLHRLPDVSEISRLLTNLALVVVQMREKYTDPSGVSDRDNASKADSKESKGSSSSSSSSSSNMDLSSDEPSKQQPARKPQGWAVLESQSPLKLGRIRPGQKFFPVR